MTTDRARVIAWIIKVIKGGFGHLESSLFLFHLLCDGSHMHMYRLCVCVSIINRMENKVTGKDRKGRQVTPNFNLIIRQYAREHPRNSFTKCIVSPYRCPFLHSLAILPFLLFSFINKIESCFSEQEIRSRSHSTGQSNREMTGATGKGYLQLLFIYLFRHYLGPWLRKGRKAIFIFLMGLPSTDNVPVLFAFSWISHATKCAGNAKCCSCSSNQTKRKLFFTRDETIIYKEQRLPV